MNSAPQGAGGNRIEGGGHVPFIVFPAPFLGRIITGPVPNAQGPLQTLGVADALNEVAEQGDAVGDEEMMLQEAGRVEIRREGLVVVDHHHGFFGRGPQQIGIAPRAVLVSHPPVEHEQIAPQGLGHAPAGDGFQPLAGVAPQRTESRSGADAAQLGRRFPNQFGGQVHHPKGRYRQPQGLSQVPREPFRPEAGPAAGPSFHEIEQVVIAPTQER